MSTRRKTKADVPFDIIKIGYVDAKVNAVESREIEKRDNIFGEWFAKNHEIDFDGDMADGEKLNTILHEVLHAIVHVWGIDFKSFDTSHEQEEHVVNAMASALITVFKDNPEYLLWMYNKLHGEEE